MKGSARSFAVAAAAERVQIDGDGIAAGRLGRGHGLGR